jgi:hypothetical protein
MQAVANNPKFAKKVGVPTSVGKEFTKKEGGVMKKMKEAGMKDSGVTKKMPTAKQMGSLGMKSGGVKKMAGGGLAAGHKSADGIAKKGKTKGKKVGMKSGGMAC